MQQRVAIARALIVEPKILLMDEPFGALDAQTRNDMQQFLLHLWENLKMTVLFITHDVEEAILLSNRVMVMTPRPGKVAAVIEVSLPHPRRWDMVLTDEFLDIKRQVLDILRPDLTHAHAAAGH
jgi:NitT/TauT family transport system ATP-binding protein